MIKLIPANCLGKKLIIYLLNRNFIIENQNFIELNFNIIYASRR